MKYIIILLMLMVVNAFAQIDPRTEQAIADSIARLEIKVDLNVDSLTAYDLRIIINADSITAHGLLIDTRIDTAIAQRTDIDANIAAIASVTSAQGETIVDSINATKQFFSIPIYSPQALEKTGLFRAPFAIVIDQIYATLDTDGGSNDSVKINIHSTEYYNDYVAPDYNGTSVFAADEWVSNTLLGLDMTSDIDGTTTSVVSGYHVWFYVAEVVGVIENMNVTVRYYRP